MQNTEKLIFKDNDVELEIIYSPEEKTCWLSTKQMAELFQKDRTSISKYLKSLTENKCAQNAHISVNFSHISGIDKRQKYYNLDVVLEIAKRLKSDRGLMLKTIIDEQLKKGEINQISDEIIIYDEGFIQA